MAASDTILGRARNCAAFETGQPFTVSAYFSRGAGRVRYTDPVCGARTKHNTVRYRIRVKPKQRSKDEQRPNRQGD